jgi:hypothetical protein
MEDNMVKRQWFRQVGGVFLISQKNRPESYLAQGMRVEFGQRSENYEHFLVANLKARGGFF